MKRRDLQPAGAARAWRRPRPRAWPRRISDDHHLPQDRAVGGARGCDRGHSAPPPIEASGSSSTPSSRTAGAVAQTGIFCPPLAHQPAPAGRASRAHRRHPRQQVGHPAAQHAGADRVGEPAAADAPGEGEMERELAGQRIERAAARLGEEEAAFGAGEQVDLRRASPGSSSRWVDRGPGGRCRLPRRPAPGTNTGEVRAQSRSASGCSTTAAAQQPAAEDRRAFVVGGAAHAVGGRRRIVQHIERRRGHAPPRPRPRGSRPGPGRRPPGRAPPPRGAARRPPPGPSTATPRKGSGERRLAGAEQGDQGGGEALDRGGVEPREDRAVAPPGSSRPDRL